MLPDRGIFSNIVEKHVHGLLFGSRTDVRLDGILLGCLAALLLRNLVAVTCFCV